MNSPVDEAGERHSYVAPACTLANAWIAFRLEDGRWTYAGTYDTEAEAQRAIEGGR